MFLPSEATVHPAQSCEVRTGAWFPPNTSSRRPPWLPVSWDFLLADCYFLSLLSASPVPDTEGPRSRATTSGSPCGLARPLSPTTLAEAGGLLLDEHTELQVAQ